MASTRFAALLVITLAAAPAAAQPTVPRTALPQAPGDIRGLVDRLYSADPRQRAEAACQLGRHKKAAAPAIPILLSMLHDDVTVSALDCEMTAWLRRALKTNPDTVRWSQTSPAMEAAEALGDIGNQSVPGLLQALTNTDWRIRKHAAVGLAEVDQIVELTKVIDAIDDRLSDVHADVRDRAAWALGEIEDAQAVEALVNTLQRDNEPRVRAMAAWALGEIEHESAVDGLIEALGDADAAVREKSVWALGEIESDLAVSGLLPLLSDAAASVRRQVVWALGEIESPQAVRPLTALLEDADVEVRRQTAWALGEIEDPAAVAALERALKDADWRVRSTAAWALGEIEDPIALEALRAAQSDQNGEVRRAVSVAIRELRDKR